MINISDSRIVGFVKSNPRHRLIIHKGINGINSCDVGFELSKQLLQLPERKNYSFKAKEILDEICKNHQTEEENLGRYQSLRNLGILFHKELGLDLNSFLKQQSLTNTLFIEWEGDVDSERLSFLSKEKGEIIYIGDITHLNLINS